MSALRILVLLAALLPGAAPGATEDEARLRYQFRVAWTAAQIGEDQSSHERELSEYVLYPYLVATRLRWRLQRGPGPALDEAISHFLQRQGEEPVARPLRQAWLLSLAERREWARLLKEMPPETTEPRLRCHALAARIALKQTDTLLDSAIASWLTPQDMPAACDPVFEWLRQRDALGTDLVSQRALMALSLGETRLVRALASRLPAQAAQSLVASAQLLDAPQAEMARQLAGGLPPDNRVVLDAYWKLARRDSDQALALRDALLRQDRFSDEDRGQILRAVALGLAFDRKPQALQAFHYVPASAMDALAYEWRVRSAIWFGEWPQALAWIGGMPAEQALEPRWRYWRARALAAMGDAAAASAVYADVAQEREYYGFLAAERLDRVPDLRPEPLPGQPELRAALEGAHGIVRARELFACDLLSEAMAEWRFALAGADLPLKQEAARLAADWGWHHQAVLMLSELQLWNDVVLRYPLPYRAEVEQAARSYSLPAEWLYSVLRQESLYNRRAVSPAGALGLLQLMPQTANVLARRTGAAAPLREELFDPGANVRLGALYLADLRARLGQRWILALASYNAGANRVAQWLPVRPTPGDVWVENIPFNETRTYVQRILGHHVIFRWRLSGEPGRVLPELDTVQAPPDEIARLDAR